MTNDNSVTKSNTIVSTILAFIKYNFCNLYVKDELLWAAAWLYKATGKSKYLNYVSSNKGWSQSVSEFSWDNKYAGVQVLLAKVRTKIINIPHVDHNFMRTQ